jgi:hypothetical protein
LAPHKLVFFIGLGKTASEAQNRLEKGADVFLAALILVSSLLISVRAFNIVREEHQIDIMNTSPNLQVKGTVTSVAFNHEVDLAYLYHVFPVYLTVNVAEVISSSGLLGNQSSAFEYLQRRGNLTVGSDKAASYVVGEQVEVNGYLSHWHEDDLFDNMRLVSDVVNGSYIQPTS